MTDYWEAIGRLATDAQLNTKFEGLKANQSAAKVINVAGGDGIGPARGLDIQEAHYDEVQDFWKSVLSQRVLSVFSAGELIWTYSFDKSRAAMQKIQQIVAGTKPQVTNPSSSYFIALGRVLVDQYVGDQLLAPNADVIQLLPLLSDDERTQICALLALPDFLLEIAAFDDDPWDNGCNVAALYWKGFVQPMGINAEHLKGGFVPFSRKQAQAAMA